ncbi:hypothetical protein EV359DRAFT_86052 [Lentinula novae-zelandiae]|nr:hypothetical protein EV359DRAFT_86052 [Lentinula novae-zelandiae]
MSASRTQTMTTTSSSTAGPSRSRPAPLPPANPVEHDEEDLEEDEDEIIRSVQEKLRRMKERKAAAAAKKKAEEEAAKKAAEEAQKQQELERVRSPHGGQWWKLGKGKGKARPRPRDPDDSGNGNDEDEQAPCEQCRSKKIPCQMQAGKRSSIICKPCHDAKVRCSYSTRPLSVKREGGSNPTGERLAILESQMAQLLANNRQLREGQVKANTYHRHFNKKLDWLMMDAARWRKSPPKMPEAGPSQLPRKRRRVVDSEEEEEDKQVEKGGEGEGEEEEVEEEGEGEAPAPKKAETAASEKGKEKAVK